MSLCDTDYDSLFTKELRNLGLMNNNSLSLFHKFSILIDIMLRQSNYINLINASLKEIIENELKSKKKLIKLEYELFDIVNSCSCGILNIEIQDSLIGSFAGKLTLIGNFKSPNSTNISYSLPLNCNSQELKNINFTCLNQTIAPLKTFLHENLINKINKLNNLNQLTANTSNIPNNKEIIINNKDNKKFIESANNFSSGRNNNLEISQSSDTSNNQFNTNFNKNIFSSSSNSSGISNSNDKLKQNINTNANKEAYVYDNSLGINNNAFFEKNKTEFNFLEKEKLYNSQFSDFSNLNKPKEAQELFNPEHIYEREFENFDKPNLIGANPLLGFPEKKIIQPDLYYYDAYNPEAEIFNPNYEYNPNHNSNPKFGYGNNSNPFFTSEGGILGGGMLVGPNSDIFSRQHPQMQKKPGANIRYDPIGPFGTFTNDKLNNNNNNFFG